MRNVIYFKNNMMHVLECELGSFDTIVLYTLSKSSHLYLGRIMSKMVLTYDSCTLRYFHHVILTKYQNVIGIVNSLINWIGSLIRLLIIFTILILCIHIQDAPTLVNTDKILLNANNIFRSYESSTTTRNRTPTLVLVLVVEFYKLSVVGRGKWAALTNSSGTCVLVMVRWFFLSVERMHGCGCKHGKVDISWSLLRFKWKWIKTIY